MLCRCGDVRGPLAAVPQGVQAPSPSTWGLHTQCTRSKAGPKPRLLTVLLALRSEEDGVGRDLPQDAETNATPRNVS